MTAEKVQSGDHAGCSEETEAQAQGTGDPSPLLEAGDALTHLPSESC